MTAAASNKTGILRRKGASPFAESIPPMPHARAQKSTMKIGLPVKLDLDGYRRRHKLRSLEQAVKRLLADDAKCGCGRGG